jgi:selenocysteine lyase
MALVIVLLNLYCFRCIREVNSQRKKEKLIRILYHTDAAQGIGKIKVDADELKVDYLTIVGHKVVLEMF